MAKPRFTLYKHIKVAGTWRYCRAALAVNNKVKPHIVVVGGTEEKHEDGSYCVGHVKADSSAQGRTEGQVSVRNR